VTQRYFSSTKKVAGQNAPGDEIFFQRPERGETNGRSDARPKNKRPQGARLGRRRFSQRPARNAGGRR